MRLEFREALWFVADIFLGSSDLTGGQEDEPGSRRSALAAVIFLLLFALVSLHVVHVLKKVDALQDCVMQGRTNCVPSRHYFNAPPP
ncbi:hypothetical protein [Acidisoma sp. S159]|uniref:hypothetical protein n=1 Tax=Acidisoma sp. S159 TaxID=1747225 RepID=UPI00131D041B|nr:hypothetical protein [Acidisoma sp. S159]